MSTRPTLRIHLKNYDAYKKQLVGNFYGYSIAYNRVIEKLLEYGVVNDPDSNIEFSFCAPSIFRGTEGKVSVCYTMFESLDLYADAVSFIRKADIILTPSGFSQKVFQKYTKKPVYVVPLGVDFIPVRDDLPSHIIDAEHPFRFLYLGAFNARKGWMAIGETWKKYFANDPELQIYIKTTHHDVQKQRIFELGNAIVDGRNVDREELTRIYHSAHCFLLPTMGEGWGQSIAEAMSAGVPVITTEWSGHLQFANRENCTFVPHELRRIPGDNGIVSAAPDALFEWAMVSHQKLAQTMISVIANYGRALKKAERAEKDILRFSWDACASNILNVLQAIERGVPHDKLGRVLR